MEIIELTDADALPEAIDQLLRNITVAAVVIRGAATQQQLLQLAAERDANTLGVLTTPPGSMARMLLEPLVQLEPVIQDWWQTLDTRHKTPDYLRIKSADNLIPIMRRGPIGNHNDATIYGPIVKSLRTDRMEAIRFFNVYRYPVWDSTHIMDFQTHKDADTDAQLINMADMEMIQQHPGDAIYIAGNPFPVTHGVTELTGSTEAMVVPYTFER